LRHRIFLAAQSTWQAIKSSTLSPSHRRSSAVNCLCIEESIMRTQQTHRYRARHHLTKSAKVIAAVLGISTFCYVGILVLEHAGSSLTAAWELTPESQRVAGTADSPATFGRATAAVPAASSPKSMGPNFDYFPDYYVNQATKNAEPIETF